MQRPSLPAAGRGREARALVLCLVLAGCGGASVRSTGASSPAPPPATSAAPPPIAGASSPPARPAAGRRPNVVFVLTDDLSWNLVRYMPHVEQLARRGLTFSNYFVTDSLCCPSRSSIFTGRFPHDTHVLSNTAPYGGFPVFHQRGEERQSFAVGLRSAGYRTALMGKYLNGYDPSVSYGTRVPPGWSEWDVAGNGYPEFGYTLNQDGRLVHYGRRPRAYLTDVIARRGVRFVDAATAAGRPFLLELATFAPHQPYVPAPRDARSFPGLRAPRSPAFDAANTESPRWLRSFAPLRAGQIRNIDAGFRRRVQSVQAVDRMVARIEAELRRRGVDRDTYIVFSSDNGLHMGEHRLPPGKMTAFDTDIRVPLIVAGPGVPRARRVAKLVQNTDLAPTFLSLAGRPAGAAVEGRSLVPFLRGQAVRGWRHAVLIEHHGPDTAPSDPDLPGPGDANPTAYEAIRTASRLYVRYADGERELYDLASDPWELHNLAAVASSTLTQGLGATLAATETCHSGAACWRSEGGG